MPEEERERIVRRLARQHRDATGSRLKRAVTDGQVTVDGAVVDDPGALVPPDASVVWDPNRRVQRRVETSIKVLFEDDDAIAVVKPAGLLTHPTEAKEKDTLVARVSAYVAKRRSGRGYLSVVHRLDKDTSGILVFAKSRRGLVTLQAQLRAHTMERVYTAIVEGSPTGERGVYDAPLVADRGDRRRGTAKEGEEGLAAVTEWRVTERLGIATRVEARLKTGRTHQVRIHFAEAGHPLVGEPVYRDARRPPFPIAFPRQALHAGRLGFSAPGGETVTLEAPLPPDMEKLLEELRRRAARRGGDPPSSHAVPEAPTRGRR
jgi:23S rRNA pseudouridine1911/1915/1917 synthase